MQKQLSRIFNLTLIFALLFTGYGQALAAPAVVDRTVTKANPSLPASSTDETKVPHYFGPFSNWANSPQVLTNAIVTVDAPTGPGTTAQAVAVVDPRTGGITGINITNPGSGYAAIPNVAISSPGVTPTKLAAATAEISIGVLSSVTVSNPGFGYTTPSVSITGGTPSSLYDATAQASGGVDSVTLVSGGSGYLIEPIVVFDLPDLAGGVRAEGVANMDAFGVVTDVTVTNPGSGYSFAPGVTIKDGAAVATNPAIVTSTISVDQIAILDGSFGYASVPDVAITDTTGTGDGATATATIADMGAVTNIIVTVKGAGYLTPGLRKFVDTLPGLGPTGANNLGQYIPVAVPDTTTYPGTDYYEIAVVQYRMKFHSDLPATLLRGYVQLSTAVVPGAQVTLTNAMLDGSSVVIPGYQGVDNPHYLGPTIVATKDRPVRILFRNLLPTGVAGDLFLPVDTSLMGSGAGPNAMTLDANNVPMDMATDLGTVMDGVRNPYCSQTPKPADCFSENRATLHLHGGITPWISDGTPHQWTTPAGEATEYPKGVSVSNVPDMPDPGPGAMTFFYTNQQSARLMFYHDHAWGITRLNVYAGEAAAYLITDTTEQNLFGAGKPFADLGIGTPLVIQDKTFVSDNIAQTDPTWQADKWGGTGALWTPHVYMPAQNPGDASGMSAFGRWMYGPWFWPPNKTVKYAPIANPYYNPACNIDVPATWQYQSDPFCEPALIPSTPNVSVGMEAFNDTPIVNGTAYPKTTVDPKPYRFRILNAANDRFWNLSWYVADPRTGTLSEVALNPVELAAAQTDPVITPTPDTRWSPKGPNWIQIGTEGGFLPAPTVIPASPTIFITDPTRFDVGNVDYGSLILGPAERADVIVDFSQFRGKTLILYNDAPAAYPARVPGYDYYTGGPDMSPVGAPTTLPGYGPNTRTIMKVTVSTAAASPAFDSPTNTTTDRLAQLEGLFAHQTDGSGVFESGQNPIIVGQSAYNSAYGTNFAGSGWCSSPTNPTAKCDGYARIQEGSSPTDTFKFDTLSGDQLSIPFEPKGMHDEMNSATFDEWGRMTANLGLEAPGATPLLQNIILYPFVNPATEILDATTQAQGLSLNVQPISAAAEDGTQIWKITHNGVDTHPIHFHLYDVQIINRVTWDNIIIPPLPNELGWKDTIRVSPLEDTIVAVRPIIPTLPFGIPDSKRVLNPMMPLNAQGDPNSTLGQEAGFSNIDTLGNVLATPVINVVTNFGWEYVFHCHILSHEEMDMMRPVIVHVGRALPDAPVLTYVGSSGVDVTLTWTDGTPVDYANPTTWGSTKGEVGYRIERREFGGVWAPFDTALANQVNYTDPTTLVSTTYNYRVIAHNEAGESVSNSITVGPDPVAAPSNLVATPVSIGQINLSWVDNSSGEDMFVIQRCTPGVCIPVTEIGNTGVHNVTTYSDIGLSAGTAYSYQVFARSLAPLDGLPSNVATATTFAALPNAPSGLTATVVSATQVNLAWTDNSTNETNFKVERAVDSGAFAPLATVAANGISYHDTTVSVGHTYDYQVYATHVLDVSAFSNTATAIVIAAPSTLVATPINAGQVDLTWADNSTNENGFSIERCTGVGCISFLQIGTAAGNAVSYSDLTTAPTTTYIYRVIATSSAPVGQSLPSNTASALTQALIPVAPTTLTATVVNAGQVDLGWTDNSLNEVNFVVERAVDGGAFATLATLGANVTAYSDTSVAADHTYDYRVKATNTGGSSAYTNTATAIVIAAPSTLVASPLNAGQVDLTWADNSANETGFSIERCTGAGCTSFAQIATAAANAVAFSDTTTAPLTSYVYRVIATSSSPVGQSLPSNTASASTPDTIPVAPSGMFAILQNGPQVGLIWNDNSTNELNFVVERSDNGGAFAVLTTLPANQIAYLDTTVLGGNSYIYRVKATNSGGSSAYSTSGTIVVIALPAAPSALTLTQLNAPVRIRLNFTDNATNESGFVIERSLNGAPFTVLTTVAARAATGAVVYTDATVVNNNNYSYRVRAINAGGSSAFAGPATLTLGTLPAAPTALVATIASSSTTNLTFRDNANNESYFVVERSANGGAFILLATLPIRAGAGNVTYSDTTTLLGNTYQYRVAAWNGLGSSAYSNTVSTNVSAPADPTNAAALAIRNGARDRITLTWTDNATNETSYVIQRATNAGFTTGLTTFNVAANGITLVQNNMARGATFYYRIQAVNAAGVSAWVTFTPFPVVTP